MGAYPTERWFLSSNAKDIGTLYLIFALFSGLVGTAFSVIIRLELAAPGVQYVSDNQLYNSVITAHAILMSAPMRLNTGRPGRRGRGQDKLVKRAQAGGAKPRGETRTAKLSLTDWNRRGMALRGCQSYLIVLSLGNITNLIHEERLHWALYRSMIRVYV